MKTIIIFLIFLNLISLIPAFAQSPTARPSDANILSKRDSALITWKNPDTPAFSQVILFRSTIPIEKYFSYEAVVGLCDQVYAGTKDNFTDQNLVENLPYYYILFASDKTGNYSAATVLEKIVTTSDQGVVSEEKNKISSSTPAASLAGATAQVVNEVSMSEAGLVYSYNSPVEFAQGDSDQRLALMIIVKSPTELTDKDKNSISYFIHNGTPTTIILGSGERAGVLNSYLSVFSKLPKSLLEWQDVIKMASGRWPNERNLDSEKRASDQFFAAIYNRAPNMNNSNDNAAVTVIAYGLRPAQRNMESEKNASKIYLSIFGHSPTQATDWDIVRAIAYSGAIR